MKLTEQDILARSNKYNLAEIHKLNMSDCGLTDVSILERLPNLQVLILSQNHIRTLKQLQKCLRLQELYLRANEIQDLDELIYLKNLPLKRLVLAENPCSREAGENYRVNAIKMLPFLESFDNQMVSREELEKALNLRILNRNFGALNSEFVEPTLDSVDLCPENMELGNESQRFTTNSVTRAGSPDDSPNPNLPEIFSQPRSAVSQQYAGEYNSLPGARLQQQRYVCNNIYNSDMDFSEWERRNPCPDHMEKYRRQRKTNFFNERTGQSRYGEPSTSNNRYESHEYNPLSARTDRSMPGAQFDDDMSDRTSSVASTYRNKVICPRSRRVNLLCASLRFVVELDALSLVDVLSVIRARIQELYSPY